MNTTSLFLLPCSGILVSCVCVISCFWLFATPWTVAHQPPLSMEFSRQEYWCGLPFPPPGDLPNPGTEPTSLASPAVEGGFFTTAPLGKPLVSWPGLEPGTLAVIAPSPNHWTTREFPQYYMFHYRYYAVQRISRIYSSCVTETFCPLTNMSLFPPSLSLWKPLFYSLQVWLF